MSGKYSTFDSLRLPKTRICPRSNSRAWVTSRWTASRAGGGSERDVLSDCGLYWMTGINMSPIIRLHGYRAESMAWPASRRRRAVLYLATNLTKTSVVEAPPPVRVRILARYIVRRLFALSTGIQQSIQFRKEFKILSPFGRFRRIACGIRPHSLDWWDRVDACFELSIQSAKPICASVYRRKRTRNAEDIAEAWGPK